MKILVVLLIGFFISGAFAREIDCTTKTYNQRTDGQPTIKWCGAIEVMAYDNGIKYRKTPRFCDKYQVEFFSIKKGDKKFSYYCEKIRTDDCYVIGIHDDASRMGMHGLSSFIVFRNVNEIPMYFTLGAGGIGHKTGAIPGPGRMYRMDLNCFAHP